MLGEELLDKGSVVLKCFFFRDVVSFNVFFSHYMYHGLVTTFVTYIVFFDIYIYIYMR